MVVSIYIGNEEIPQSDLNKIIITRNGNIKALVDRVVARINNTEKVTNFDK